jgi:hypothetical protein
MYVRKQYVQIYDTIISFYCLEKYKKITWQAVLWIRIRDLGSGAFLTPGSGSSIREGEKTRSWIWDEHPGSYFRELKILNFFYADPGSFRPWNRELLDPGSGIRDGKLWIWHPK